MTVVTARVCQIRQTQKNTSGPIVKREYVVEFSVLLCDREHGTRSLMNTALTSDPLHPYIGPARRRCPPRLFPQVKLLTVVLHVLHGAPMSRLPTSELVATDLGWVGSKPLWLSGYLIAGLSVMLRRGLCVSARKALSRGSTAKPSPKEPSPQIWICSSTHVDIRQSHPDCRASAPAGALETAPSARDLGDAGPVGTVVL